MLPTTDLFDTARMPLCTYTVRRGSTTGEIVSYARVGDTIYHVWHCESGTFVNCAFHFQTYTSAVSNRVWSVRSR